MELGFKLRCWTTFRADTLTTKLYYLATVHTAGGSFWFSRKTNTKKCHINFIRAPCFLFGLGVQGEPSHLPVACTRTQANKHTIGLRHGLAVPTSLITASRDLQLENGDRASKPWERGSSQTPLNLGGPHSQAQQT